MLPLSGKYFEKRIFCLKFPGFGGNHQNSKKIQKHCQNVLKIWEIAEGFPFLCFECSYL
jgi:hypothetical protein